METKTTVTIDQRHNKILDRLCKNYTKKDFICACIRYCEKHGIDPLSHESPAQEMQKLIKRIDQVIGFIRTQEKEFLRPSCEAIFTSEERIKQYLESLSGKEESSQLKLILHSIKTQEMLLSEIKNAQEQFAKQVEINSQKKKGFF